MQFSQQKRGQKFHDGFTAALEELILLIKNNPDITIERLNETLIFAVEQLKKKNK
jgi:hypothetical protein